MRQLVTLLVFGALGFFAYNNFLNRKQAVAPSHVIEPFYGELFGPLSAVQPSDLVPPLKLLKERILAKQASAEPEKRALYDKTIALLNGMIPLAQERTKALEAVVKGAKTKASLDSPYAPTSTTAFFARTTSQQWEQLKARQKPILDQMLIQLRTAENELNKRVGPKAEVEGYNLPEYTPVAVTVGTPASGGASAQRSSSNPWGSSPYGTPAHPQPMQRRTP